jgi:hypothetical protein
MVPVLHRSWRSFSCRCVIACWAALALVTAALAGQPPLQESVVTQLGPKAYRDGDVIEITNVAATSPKLEQGDSLTVTGRVRLQSQEAADLCLSVTQTQGNGFDMGDGNESIHVKKGQREFSLKMTIKHRGPLHVTLYDSKSGRPIGGTYFGTTDQMKKIADWNVAYYLPNVASYRAN